LHRDLTYKQSSQVFKTKAPKGVGLGLKLFEKWKEFGGEKFDNIYV